MGLTGDAVQWVVRKQKGHRSVSRTVMMHLDAVLKVGEIHIHPVSHDKA